MPLIARSCSPTWRVDSESLTYQLFGQSKAGIRMDTLERSPSVLTEVPKPAVLCVGFPGTERSGMEHALGSIGLRAIWAGTYKQALSAVSRLPPIVLVDLGGDEAFRIARVLRAQRRGGVVIGVVEATGRRLTADAVRAGVVEIARKPLLGPELAVAIHRARQGRANSIACTLLTPAPDTVFVRSTGMRTAVERAVRLGASRRGISMIGEPGTGRELLARTLHRLDGQECDTFIVVDCVTARPGDLETELLGTGLDVVGSYQGCVYLGASSALCRAIGGTLFLKNIGEMPPRVRARLARILEHRRVYSDRRYLELDVRLVVSAEPSAHTDLALTDFSSSTSLERIIVPPLRERREDIPLLANYFLDQLGASTRPGRKALTPAAVTLLTGLRWRGNADELKALVTRLVDQVPGEVIRLEDVVETVRLDDGGPAAEHATLSDARARFEREYITSVLDQHDGRVRDAARVLGIRRTNVYRKLRQIRLRASQELEQPVGRNNAQQASTELRPVGGLRDVSAGRQRGSPTESGSSRERVAWP